MSHCELTTVTPITLTPVTPVTQTRVTTVTLTTETPVTLNSVTTLTPITSTPVTKPGEQVLTEGDKDRQADQSTTDLAMSDQALYEEEAKTTCTTCVPVWLWRPALRGLYLSSELAKSKSAHFEFFTSARKTKTENALRARVFEIYISYFVGCSIVTQ